VRSERQLSEQLSYNLLFRWFTGLAIDDPVWDVTVFTKDRDRLLDGAIAAKFFQAVLSQPQVKALLSDEHFTVDGTLIEAFASLKSFKPKADPGAEPPAGGGRNAERDFHGERRSNATHGSTTYPEARLLHKGRGKEAKLCFMGHLLMKNRHGLIVDIRRSIATTPTRLGLLPQLSSLLSLDCGLEVELRIDLAAPEVATGSRPGSLAQHHKLSPVRDYRLTS